MYILRRLFEKSAYLVDITRDRIFWYQKTKKISLLDDFKWNKILNF